MAKKTADGWALAALRALAEGGVPAVRVEVLARRLGVTKGSFYHHFESRRQLLDRAVEAWEQLATEQVIETVNAGAGTPEERLVALAKVVFPAHEMNDAIEAALRAKFGLVVYGCRETLSRTPHHHSTSCRDKYPAHVDTLCGNDRSSSRSNNRS